MFLTGAQTLLSAQTRKRLQSRAVKFKLNLNAEFEAAFVSLADKSVRAPVRAPVCLFQPYFLFTAKVSSPV